MLIPGILELVSNNLTTYWVHRSYNPSCKSINKCGKLQLPTSFLFLWKYLSFQFSMSLKFKGNKVIIL